MIKLDVTEPFPGILYLNKGALKKIEITYTNKVGKQSTSVTSVDWETQGAISISNASLSSNVAMADLTVSRYGVGELKLTATQANGEIDIKEICIRVREDCCYA